MTTRQTPDAVRGAVAQLREALGHAEGHESQSVMVKCADLRAALDSRADHDRRIYEQGRHDACADHDIALDSRAGDAGEAVSALRALLVIAGTPITERQEAIFRRAEAVVSATPAPAVDAVPAGEVERLARIRTSMALLQQNSEGCAQNHYGDDATVHGMPGWLIDTKADLDAFTDILAKWEADRG